MEEIARAYLAAVGQVCADVLGDQLAAAWAVGSLVMGDFDVRRSDVDVLVVSRRSLTDREKAALGRLLRHSSLRCPAHGLDLVVYRASEIADLRREPHYEFSISSGIDWDDEITLGGPYPGGLIDLAAAYESGVSILGGSPRHMMGRCPDAWIAEELRRGIEWHKTHVHDPFHDPSGANAVLNACRALYFVAHRTFVSKSAGAGWILATRSAPVVAEALARRREGRMTDRIDEVDVLDFLDVVSAELGDGAA